MALGYSGSTDEGLKRLWRNSSGTTEGQVALTVAVAHLDELLRAVESQQ